MNTYTIKCQSCGLEEEITTTEDLTGFQIHPTFCVECWKKETEEEKE